MPFEILVADDASAGLGSVAAIVVTEGTCDKLEGCRFIELERNVGRASIRNLLADESRGEKLLFIDCDAEVCSDDFITAYMEAAEQADVVCGGLRHSVRLPQKGVELRWKYERRADRHRAAKYRSVSPYARFTPFSFLIDREVFMQIRFDEGFSGYGYEDVRFGMELEKRGVKVLHIDNPLIHTGLEDNRIYLDKTDEAIRNLYLHRDELRGGSTLLGHYRRLERLHLTNAFMWLAESFSKPIVKNLTGRHPSLKLFAVYKMLCLCRLFNQK